MAFSRNHAVAADGTFSSQGALEWDKDHAVTDATSGGIPYFYGTTSEASSALLAANSLVIGGGAGAAPFTSANLTFDSSTTLLTVGSGVTTNTGWVIGYSGASGVASLVKTGTTNHGIFANASYVGIRIGSSTNHFQFDGSVGMSIIAARAVSWRAGNGTEDVDTGLSRISAGVIGVGTGAGGSVAGTISAAAYVVGGAAGASFGPAAVASITVVNGIITDIS